MACNFGVTDVTDGIKYAKINKKTAEDGIDKRQKKCYLGRKVRCCGHKVLFIHPPNILTL
jgi:hypothetical protein